MERNDMQSGNFVCCQFKILIEMTELDNLALHIKQNRNAHIRYFI